LEFWILKIILEFGNFDFMIAETCQIGFWDFGILDFENNL